MNEIPPEEQILQRLEQLEKQIQSLSDRLNSLEQAPSAATQQPEKVEEPPPLPQLPITRQAPEQPKPQGKTPGMPISGHYREGEPLPHRERPAEESSLFFESEPQAVFQPALKPTRKDAYDWKPLLKRLNLLPPSGEGTLEVQVGTWWATRIGMLLAVIGVVFFGVYISQNAPHWVKFIELAAVSLGVTAAGFCLERRYQKFGSVLFAGGLALVYFTTFAAYAVPPVKIISSQSVAASLQFAAVLAIILCALWRNAPVIATMATFLGYVSCFFSFSAGLNNFALAAALILGIGSAYFYIIKRWPRPIQISIPFTYLLYVFIFIFSWSAGKQAPGFWFCHGWLIVYLLTYGATDYLALLRGALMDPYERRLVQICNSVCAVALGFLVTHSLFHPLLDTYYFTYGILLLGASLLYYLTQNPGVVMQSYFIKGSALFTMGIVTHYEARTRWVALACESLVLLFSARRSRLKSVEAAMAVVWYASFIFFFKYLSDSHLLAHPGSIWSLTGMTALGYLLLSALLFCLQARWLGQVVQIGQSGASVKPIASPGMGFDDVNPRDGLNTLYGLTVGIVGLLTALAFVKAAHLPTGATLIAVAIAVVGLLTRHWVAYLAAAIPFLLAHLFFWASGDATATIPRGCLNAAVPIFFTIALAARLYQTSRPRSLDTTVNPTWLSVEGFLHILWMITLNALYYKVTGIDLYLFLAVATSIAVAAVSIRFPLYLLGDFSALPMALALAGLLSSIKLTDPRHEVLLWLAPIGAFAYACAYVSRRELNARLRLLKSHDAYQWVHATLALLLGYYTITQSHLYARETSMVVLGLAALAVAALARRPGLKPAVYLGIFYVLCAFGVFLDCIRQAEGGSLSFLMLAVLTAILIVAYALLAWRLSPGLPIKARRAIQWVHGVLAIVLLFMLFRYQGGALHHYVTALWGISAIGIFLVGLADKVKPLRIIGLCGLALCIPRVFIVDVQSTLYRIAAFGVLGFVLLTVGFLYTKYRDVLERTDEAHPVPPKHEGESAPLAKE